MKIAGYFNYWLCSQTLLLKIKECTAVVDFRFRMLAFRRLGGETHRCVAPRGSPVPLLLQESAPYAPINYYLWLKTTIF